MLTLCDPPLFGPFMTQWGRYAPKLFPELLELKNGLEISMDKKANLLR